MKCIITGSKEGIGKAILDTLSNDYEVYCPNTRIEDLNLDFLSNNDLFINNAFSHQNQFRQCELIYEAYNVAPYHRQIVIGSMTSDYTKLKDKEPHMYSTAKLAVEAMSHQMFAKGKKCTLIKPGYVNTKSAKHSKEPKLETIDIADIIKYILHIDDEIIIKEISLKRFKSRY